MKKVVTAHNYVRKGYTFEKPSLTVPGQTLPVRTVLDRFRRGQSVQSFTPVYNPEFPAGYERLNKLDRIDLAREQAAEVQRQRSILAARDAQAKRSAAQAEQAAKKGAADVPPPAPET